MGYGKRQQACGNQVLSIPINVCPFFSLMLQVLLCSLTHSVHLNLWDFEISQIPLKLARLIGLPNNWPQTIEREDVARPARKRGLP